MELPFSAERNTISLPKSSLIIATYNSLEFLRVVLETALEQTRLPDEIIIADDGSREDTAALVRKFAAGSPVPLLHAWQPDEGFRLARSRNNAIAASTGEYLIFIDGDCFLNRFFVEDHLSLVEENFYIVGTRVNIGPRRRDHVLRTGHRRISFWSWGTHKKFHAIRSRFLSNFRKKGGMAGANFSAWRKDIVRINGFNEIFEGHGGEDWELASRLERSGMRRKKMVHLGIAYHFAHPENPRGDGDRISRIYADSVDEQGIRCKHGLDRAVKNGINILNNKTLFDQRAHQKGA